MKLIPALATICALVLPCALHAETFEGKLTMTMSSSQKEGNQTLNLSLKEGLMRTDIQSERGTMSAIMDSKNQQMIILMPQQRMYMVQPFPAPGQAPMQGGPAQGARAASDASLQDTGVKETILGYVCTKFVATSSEGTAQIWVTDQLGTFTGLFHGAGGPMGHRPQAPQAWESALKGHNFFPMRVVSSNSKGTFRLEVTSVQKMSLPDSDFAAPDGWRKFDMGAMMGGAMQGGYPGARPSPGDN